MKNSYDSFGFIIYFHVPKFFISEIVTVTTTVAFYYIRKEIKSGIMSKEYKNF